MNDVVIVKHSPMQLKIVTEDTDYISHMINEFTSYVEGFQFMPQYKAGGWNGQTNMIHRFSHTFPYGLLFDVIRAHKKLFPRNKLIVDGEVKNLFRGPELAAKFDLKLYPRPYQEDCIRAALKYSKGIIRSATASGKSLVIAYIIKTLLSQENSGVQRAFIIVPSTGLIKQFHEDLMDYGFPDQIIGEVYAKRKQWDNPVVITTWQSLKNNHVQLKKCQAVIVDEVHGAKAFQLKKILVNSVNCKYRLGFTGTMHAHRLDNWNVKSYLGPIIREYPSGLLAEQGYVSQCNIHLFNMEYMEEIYEGSYDEIKDLVFNRPYRMELVKKLVCELDHNVLLLVGKVEKEGDVLKEILSKNCSKRVEFLSGRDDVSIREEWRKKCMKRDDIALIATYGIFQQGINIPNLKYIVFVSPFKSKIRVLQSVGRALRTHADKENGAHIFDIVDNTKFLKKHGDIRLRYYDSEKFNVDEWIFQEGDPIVLPTTPIVSNSSTS